MTAHRRRATCRCLWCPRTFDTPREATAHMKQVHRENFARDGEAEAAAALTYYHQDREAVRKGRPVADEDPNTPRGLGRELAERMHGIPDGDFLPELEEILEAMHEEMLARGRPASIAFMICREIRQAARLEWARLTCREAVANDC